MTACSCLSAPLCVVELSGWVSELGWLLRVRFMASMAKVLAVPVASRSMDGRDSWDFSSGWSHGPSGWLM